MNKITIKTQAELDALPDKFDVYTVIEIKSSDLIIIRKKRENSSAELWGNSSAVLRENSSAELWENSSAVLRENSSAVLWGNSSAVLRENSSAELWENSSAELWENSSAVLRENSSAELWENSSAVLRENSSAVLWGNSSAELWENSLGHIWSACAKIGSAKDQAVIIFENDIKPAKIPGRGKGVQIIKRKAFRQKPYTLKDFVEIYKKNLIDAENIVLFKSVNPKTGCDFHSGTIKYEGIVVCPEFDPSPGRECGGGLHLSPSKGLATSHSLGKLLKCKVKLSDIVVYGPNITKVRCRRVEVLGDA